VQVNRSELLTVLESIQPGLTTRDTVEQSSCFAFKDGMVVTFNDEIACRRAAPLKLEGAVFAAPLLNSLRKLPEELVEVRTEENQLVVVGKRRRFAIALQNEVSLPFEKVELPTDWSELNPDFSDAVYMVSQCVGKDESDYMGTCIHVHTKYLEACDNHQAIRYKLKTRVREPILVRGSSLRHIVSLDMTAFAETDSWIHFKNPTGMILSCRRDVQEYDSLGSILACEGEPITLPKGLADAAERAEVFSAENADENEVLVSIKDGKLRVTGEGVSGWFAETKKVKYTGAPIQFKVGPKLLADVTRRYNDCIITSDRIKVDGGKFAYVVALGNPEEKEAEQPKKKTKAKAE